MDLKGRPTEESQSRGKLHNETTSLELTGARSNLDFLISSHDNFIQLRTTWSILHVVTALLQPKMCPKKLTNCLNAKKTAEITNNV